MATNKMKDDSVVSLRRSGRGHVDKLRLRKGAQTLTTSFSPPVMKLGTHNVPKNQHGNNNAKGREVIRCEYGGTEYVWASNRGKRACPRYV